MHRLQECMKRLLYFRRRLSLVFLDEVGHSGLNAQGPQVLLHGPVIDVREEERGLHLARLHVVKESGQVLGTGISGAVAPDGVQFVRDVPREPGQVGIAISIAVAFDNEVLRIEVFFASRHSDIDHVVKHH